MPRTLPISFTRHSRPQAGTVVARTWEVGERIGQGTFSEVNIATNRETAEVVAIKIEKPSGQPPQLAEEHGVLASLQPYPFFPRLLDFW